MRLMQYAALKHYIAERREISAASGELRRPFNATSADRRADETPPRS